MKPIYWDPLHEISNVYRATWFYQNTMHPVEVDLANKLEEGYLNYFRPWTETWQDELNSCEKNGPDAEMKIMHRLWHSSRPSSRPRTAQDSKDSSISDNDASIPDENKAAANGTATAGKAFANYSAVYIDAETAQILRPSLLPSVTRRRTPLAAIRKGRQIGIPVVRGFSWKDWHRLHPPKPSPIYMRHYLRYTQSRTPAQGEEVCYACAIEDSRPKPTDLVLVIHGIGQKLSERMDSFRFTHAINALRRNVHEALNSEPVLSHVREDHGGIMVLPVNWRATLSLGSVSNDDQDNHFSLKDITPHSIPMVRTLISDVMLDIPYYLSHHKPKMIQAVAKEANRVYHLWCANNPGFQERGNVHLIAHSLGSVMAVDILSNQPTRVPPPPPPGTFLQIRGDMFEFDTKNIFLVGSPVGFFLLLNKGLSFFLFGFFSLSRLIPYIYIYI